MRHRCLAALAAQRPAASPGLLGRRPGLVHEDQPFGVETGLGLEPSLSAAHYVRPLLLAGVRDFF